MALIPNSPWAPGMTTDVFVPDQLIAGDLKLVTETVNFGGSTTYPRGQVVGMITATGVWIKSVKTATDGSEVPAGIVVDLVDTTTTSPNKGGVYLMGEFNYRALTYDASWGTAGSDAALLALRIGVKPTNIFIKTTISAADPT